MHKILQKWIHSSVTENSLTLSTIVDNFRNDESVTFIDETGICKSTQFYQHLLQNNPPY